jgi:hypothetical protein
MNVISANYRRTRLKPSSSARLERWALTLRLARIERGTKPVLDDSDLQAHIRRRFESEWRRDGAPADVLSAIGATFGVESVEHHLARAEYRAFLKNEEARAWRDTLLSAWKEDYVSLSAIVWWIATGGEPRDCDEEELENAARTLLRQARSKEAPLSVKGRRSSESSRESVPRDDLSDAMPFVAMDERKFFSGAPCLHWNSMLEDARGDVIENASGLVSWRNLAIEREDMLQLWPAPQDEDLAESAGSANAREDQMLPYKTGAQGRPSPIQLVEREAERRRASGNSFEKVSEEADHLHKWCRREHPNAPTPTSKTIENKIRCAHRNWKATK